MSIDKITSNKIVQFPDKIAEKNEVKPEEDFQKALDHAQGTTSQVDKTAVAQEASKILPIQTNYHVLSQIRPTYSPQQLTNDAWNYIFTGKAPNFVNQADKTEFAHQNNTLGHIQNKDLNLVQENTLQVWLNLLGLRLKKL